MALSVIVVPFQKLKIPCPAEGSRARIRIFKCYVKLNLSSHRAPDFRVDGGQIPAAEKMIRTWVKQYPLPSPSALPARGFFVPQRGRRSPAEGLFPQTVP